MGMKLELKEEETECMDHLSAFIAMQGLEYHTL